VNVSDGFPAVPPPPNNQKFSNSARVPSIFIVTYVALGVALLGSFLPWAKVLFITVNGTDGDGMITAAASAGALALTFAAARSSDPGLAIYLFGFLSSALSTGVYIYHFQNLSNFKGDNGDDLTIAVNPGVGLIFGSIGSVAGTICLIILMTEARHQRRRP
jgi:hypothetical protein